MKNKTLLGENTELVRLCIPYSDIVTASQVCTKLRSLRIWRDYDDGVVHANCYFDLRPLKDLRFLECLEVAQELENIRLPFLPTVRVFECTSAVLNQMVLHDDDMASSDPQLVFPNLDVLRLRDSTNKKIKETTTTTTTEPIWFVGMLSHPKLVQIDVGDSPLSTFIIISFVDRKCKDRTYFPALTHLCATTFSLCLMGATLKMATTWYNHYYSQVQTGEVTETTMINVCITNDMAQHWNSILLPQRRLG